MELDEALPPLHTCGRGHRSSLAAAAEGGGGGGGVICLACFSALLSDPLSPSHHVSHALSQLSLALRADPAFARALRARHPHLLAPPLVRALASAAAADDAALARQAVDLIVDLSVAASDAASVSADFLGRLADLLSSPLLEWSRRQIYALHCFGVLLNSHQDDHIATNIRKKAALFSNLVKGLQLPCEEVRGEILFVLYKLFLLEVTPWEEGNNNFDALVSMEKLLRLSLEVLLKAQNDDARLNCVALLLVMARRGFFENSFASDQTGIDMGDTDKYMHTDERALNSPLINLFAEAIKGPLLSCDTQVQISTLDLIFHSLSSDFNISEQIQVLVEENVADYVFEVLRLSGNKDPLVISCLQVLDLFATEEETFIQRLAIGFPMLLSALRYVAGIPLHPVQSHVLRLVLLCISTCPGIISISQVEEIAIILTEILKTHSVEALSVVSEVFTLSCSIFAEILKSPSSNNTQKLSTTIQEASRNAVVSSIKSYVYDNQLLLYSLYLLKEAYMYICNESSNLNSDMKVFERSIIKTCEDYLLPWLDGVLTEVPDEEVILGVLETFHVVLLKGSEGESIKFARTLASSSWFSLSFGFLGLYPSDLMKTRVYLMLGSVIDRTIGSEFGEAIRDAYACLPSDPLDLIYLLGQRSSHDLNLASCQSAILVILYVSTLFGERLASENEVLAALEQYIILNSTNFSCGISDSMILTQLIHLYSFVRASSFGYRVAYNAEAEKTIFRLISEKEWDLLTISIHPLALEWLFQQEALLRPLSYQLLNFSKFYNANKSQICVHLDKMQIMSIQMIAQLAVSGDNYVMQVLVLLLKEIVEEGREDDANSVMNVLGGVLKIYPDASNQLCLEGIADALRCSYYSTHSLQNFMTCSLTVFNVLYSANNKTLIQEGEWLAIMQKLLEHLNPKLACQSCDQEEYLVIAIFCIVLHHSTNQVLKEPAKSILFSNSLISSVENVVQTACAKGLALLEHEEGTTLGESLIFVLLLNFFSLKSLHAVLQDTIDWQDYLQLSDEVDTLSVLSIKCRDLCRLLSFGSSLVKLVASQCLVELLTRISEQRNNKGNELRCSSRYLESMMAVTEGLLFFGDYLVAGNCGKCFAMILSWEKFGLVEKKAIKDSKWCRIVMEEFAMALTASGLTSRCFTNQHKPAAYIAVSLLKSDQVPGWMKSLFDSSCISGIVDNLSASNVTAEMVMFFRELMMRNYLNDEHIATLHQLFQVCRKQAYEDDSKKQFSGDSFDNVVADCSEIDQICRILIHLMLSPDMGYSDAYREQTKLLEEIDLFFQVSTTR